MIAVGKKYCLILLLLVSGTVSAQIPYTDDTSIDAFYLNHMTLSSELEARAILEQANQLIHDYVSDEGQDYRDINANLDRYTRLFDIIDLLVRGLQTAMTATETYNTIISRVEDYRALFEEYHENILKQFRVVPEDTVILVIGAATVDQFLSDCIDIYDSFKGLIMYCTPVTKLSCTTSDLMGIINSIKYSLENLSRHLNEGYSAMWRYMNVRMSYWKRDIIQPREKGEIAVGALERWKSLAVY